MNFDVEGRRLLSLQTGEYTLEGKFINSTYEDI
jgi:hypothetical protein